MELSQREKVVERKKRSNYQDFTRKWHMQDERFKARISYYPHWYTGGAPPWVDRGQTILGTGE